MPRPAPAAPGRSGNNPKAPAPPEAAPMVMAAVPKKRRRGWLMSSDIAFSLEEWRQARTLDDDRPAFQVRAQLAAPSTRRLVESSVYCCKASWIGPRRRAA